MTIYPLDAAGAGLLLGLAIIFLFLTVLTEGITMTLSRYTPAAKSFLNVIIINLASLIGGYLLVLVWPDLFEITPRKFYNYILLYAITVAMEYPVLWAMNKTKPLGRTLGIVLLINLVSYLVLYALTYL